MADHSDSWQNIMIPVAEHCDFTQLGCLVALDPRPAVQDREGKSRCRVPPFFKGQGDNPKGNGTVARFPGRVHL